MQYASSACGDLRHHFTGRGSGTDHLDMHGISINLAVNCYRLDAQLFCCTYYPTSNFSAAASVNNASKGATVRLATGWQSRFYQIKVSLSSKCFHFLPSLLIAGIRCDVVNLPVVNVRPSVFIELETL